MTADLNAQLGSAIRQRRILLALTQDALAKQIGVSWQQVQKYESGKDQVVFVRLVQIAKALKTTAAGLVTAALSEQAASGGNYERQTLELLKRLEKLTPNQRRGVQLLVNHLAMNE